MTKRIDPNKKTKTWPKKYYKKTEQVLGFIEDILKIDWSIEEASRHAGIDPDTYYRRVKEDPELYERFEKAKKYPYILARKTLMKGIEQWDSKYAIEYLKRRDERYSDKSKVMTEQKIDVSLSEQEEQEIDDVLDDNI